MCPLSSTISLSNITILLLAILSGFSKRSPVVEAIRCYKCGATEERTIVSKTNSTITIPKCSNFAEHAENYVKDCQYSTMCLKTITFLHLQHKVQTTITRGCATQKDIQQVFNNDKWDQKYSIQEVFEEGCMEEKANIISTSSSKTECYCRGDLCNNSQPLHSFSIAMYGLSLICCLFLHKFQDI